MQQLSFRHLIKVLLDESDWVLVPIKALQT